MQLHLFCTTGAIHVAQLFAPKVLKRGAPLAPWTSQTNPYSSPRVFKMYLPLIILKLLGEIVMFFIVLKYNFYYNRLCKYSMILSCLYISRTTYIYSFVFWHITHMVCAPCLLQPTPNYYVYK